MEIDFFIGSFICTFFATVCGLAVGIIFYDYCAQQLQKRAHSKDKIFFSNWPPSKEK